MYLKIENAISFNFNQITSNISHFFFCQIKNICRCSQKLIRQMEDQRTIWRIRYWNGVEVWDQKPREMKELCFKYNEIFVLKIASRKLYWFLSTKVNLQESFRNLNFSRSSDHELNSKRNRQSQSECSYQISVHPKVDDFAP